MEKNPAPLGMPQKVLIVRKHQYPFKMPGGCIPKSSSNFASPKRMTKIKRGNLRLYLEDDPPATLVRMVQDFTWQSEALCNERIGRVLASEKVLDEAS